MTIEGAYPHAQVIESLTSGVIAVDREGTILIANTAAGRQLHTDPTLLRAGTKLQSGPAAAALLEVIAELRDKGEPISRREIHIEAPDGNCKVVGLTASALQGPNTYNGAILLFVDLTEVRALERAAALNRQLAEIGELTAGVVHELRNPLSVISGMAELLARRLGDSHEQTKTVTKIIHEAEQLDKTIRQFLSFARPFDLEMGACKAEEILERAVQLTSHKAQSKQIALSVSCKPGIPVFAGDAAKLAQAVANVAANAIDILSPGGKVWLDAAAEPAAAVFSIDDNGPGIHLKPGDDLFAPFFSKKSGGTGLGLAIVHRIVTAHKGKVTFNNRDEGGAHFEIRIPLHRE